MWWLKREDKQDPEEKYPNGQTAKEPTSAAFSRDQPTDVTENLPSRPCAGSLCSHKQQFCYCIKKSNWRGGMCKDALGSSREGKSLSQQPCDLYNPVALGEGCGEARRDDYRKRKKTKEVLPALTGSTQVHQASVQGLQLWQSGR